MTDTVAQFIAGALLLGVCGIGAWLGYRAGFRNGLAAGSGPKRKRPHPFRVVRGDGEQPRKPRPPQPPESVH